MVARRTSPTNIGMSLLSSLAAHDLGYLTAPALIERLDRTLTTLEGLERYRGHFLNWYHTSTLAPLHPRYVSTVDSGNLAGALNALANGLLALEGAPQTVRARLAGLVDAANQLGSASASSTGDAPDRAIATAMNRLARSIAADARRDPSDETIARLRALATELRDVAPDEDPGITYDDAGDRVYWRRAVLEAVAALDAPVPSLKAEREMLARRAMTLADAMQFEFLYDRRKRIFAIGYRLADADGPGRLDESFYDLLASEARLASFVAIAKGDVPQHHWFHLGRLVTNVNGRATLVSWGGTMFEYLMPLLLMRSFPGTLLDQSCRAAVLRQIEYARGRNVPWGISESAYVFTDRSGNYQYRAFGVPGLGLKRGLADDLVVAPYATVLAALVDPAAAADNMRKLAKAGLDARFGFYEALDYRPRTRDVDAAPGDPASPTPVKAFFAHHQGMSLVAIANVLCDDAFVARFHADPRVQATELLLQERVPREAILSEPRPAESDDDGAVDPGVLASRASARRIRRARTRSSSRTAATRRRSRTSGAATAPGAAWRSPGSARIGPRTRARTTSSFATRGPGTSGRRPINRSVTSRRVTRRRSISTRSPSGRATAISKRSSRSPCRQKTTSKCGGCRSSIAARARARLRSRATPRSCWPVPRTTSRIRPSASCSSRPSWIRRVPACSSAGVRAAPRRTRPGCSTCSASKGVSVAPSSGRPIARDSSVVADRQPTRWHSTAGRCQEPPARCSTRSRPCATG